MLELVPHPDFPSVAVIAITVDAGRKTGGELVARFHVEGDLDAVIWPDPSNDGRADNLWRHTCYEAFVGYVDEMGYSEFNFSPSRQWAAYRFDGYRTGLRNEADVLFFGSWTRETTNFHAASQTLAQPRAWRLGLSAIIEARDGSKSFWALRHPPGPPDFHHADCFAARVEAPGTP